MEIVVTRLPKILGLGGLLVMFSLGLNAGATEPKNSGFEDGLNAWKIADGTVSLTKDARNGLEACRIESDGKTSGHASSVSFPVKAHGIYRLSSYVRQIEGTSAYKVVIAWLDQERNVIHYDNDWAGYNWPFERYTLHGGDFTAPPHARYAELIIGVGPNSVCLFDDVQLMCTGMSAPTPVLTPKPYKIQMSPDFRINPNPLFADDVLWQDSKSAIDTFKISIRELFASDRHEDWIRDWHLDIPQMVKSLQAGNIDLAIECGAIDNYKTGLDTAKAELSLFDRIYAAGGEIESLMLDGPISRIIKGGRLKGQGGSGDGNLGYTLEESVRHLVDYIQHVHKKYPDIEIGLGVNFDWWDFQGYAAFMGKHSYTEGSGCEYDEVANAVITALDAVGDRICFIHVDNPFNYYTQELSPYTSDAIDDPGKILAMEKYCREKRLQFGLIYNSEAPNTEGAQEFHEDSMRMLQMHRTMGGFPDEFIVQSWHTFPEELFPDNEPYSFKWWMLLHAVTAKKPRPVFALHVSDDLRTWTAREPLCRFTEDVSCDCPHMLKMSDKYYIIAAEHDSIVSDKIEGPYTNRLRPFDCGLFAVPKGMYDGKRYIIMAWVHDFFAYRDEGSAKWGGTISMAREIYAGNNRLYQRPVKEIVDYFDKQVLSLESKPKLRDSHHFWKWNPDNSLWNAGSDEMFSKFNLEVPNNCTSHRSIKKR